MEITPCVVKMEGRKAMICITLVVALLQLATATDYTVGGPVGGWDMSTDYRAWVASQKLAPGDSLTFKYQPFHDVVEVTKAGYDACSAANPIASYTGGSTTIVLAAPGNRYFICGIPGHCQAGMKLDVDVAPADKVMPPPQHAKRASLAPMPLPPAPAPVAAKPRHAKHKKSRRRPCPPPHPAALARAPVMVSTEVDLPLVALAPVSAPPPPMSSGVAASSNAKSGEVAMGLGLGVLMVFAL